MLPDVDDDELISYEEARAANLKAAKPKPTFSVRASMLRVNHVIVIKGRPVRLVDSSQSKAGRGTVRRLIARDIFTDKKLEEVIKSTHFIDAPVLTRAEYTLANIDTPILNLLTDDGEPKDDVNVPKGALGKRLVADFAEGKDLRVSTLEALGEEQVVAYEESI
ncbi:translation initiation factor eIF-5A, partial [Mycena vitilis]